MAENMMNSSHKDNRVYRDKFDDIEWVDYSKDNKKDKHKEKEE